MLLALLFTRKASSYVTWHQRFRHTSISRSPITFYTWQPPCDAFPVETGGLFERTPDTSLQACFMMCLALHLKTHNIDGGSKNNIIVTFPKARGQLAGVWCLSRRLFLAHPGRTRIHKKGPSNAKHTQHRRPPQSRQHFFVENWASKPVEHPFLSNRMQTTGIMAMPNRHHSPEAKNGYNHNTSCMH